MKQVSDIFYTSWDQLTPQQAIQVILLKQKLDQLEKSEYYEQMGQVRYVLLTLLCKKDKVMKKLNELQLNDIAEDLNLFWMQPFYFFHIQGIKAKDFTYYSPGEKMHDLTFFHLVYADAYFTRYLISEDKHILDQMIAVLYHPNTEGDRWELNLKNIEPMAKDIGEVLHPHEKLLIMTSYGHIRNFLIQRCPTLIPPDPDGESAEVQYTGESWRDIMYDLSETPAYQGMEKAKNAPLIEALDYLEKKAIEARELKQKMKHA